VENKVASLEMDRFRDGPRQVLSVSKTDLNIMLAASAQP
jgi:hypothetical protein